MAKIIVTAQVEDATKWEEGFRTHGDLFRSQTVSSPIDIAINEGNEVALCMEVDDVDTYFQILESPATAEAMAFDGVKRETVKIFVFDRQFEI
ncbi:MAG: hypothetical protein OEQ53_22670 [Saprospiraceae bacterium]|nr:hypothetical protein [Saprospiraceae bacterium]